MNCHIATFRKPSLRALISRVLGLFLVLQALIPGVLAYSAAVEGVWCRSVATAATGDMSPSAGQEPCLVCVIMASGNAPLPTTVQEFPAQPVAAGAIPTPSRITCPTHHATGQAPPIRAPPLAIAATHGTRPVHGVDGCALT